jgi:hypothetical protein
MRVISGDYKNSVSRLKGVCVVGFKLQAFFLRLPFLTSLRRDDESRSRIDEAVTSGIRSGNPRRYSIRTAELQDFRMYRCTLNDCGGNEDQTEDEMLAL